MGTIKNTSRLDEADALLILAESMGPGGPSGAIEAVESRGQQELVNSDRLPTRVLSEDRDAPFLAAGFTFGEPDPGDPLFRAATLPVGWKRIGTDHAMWSKVVDEHGRERVAIFYKAAWYDRDAHMSWTTRYGYLQSALYDGREPVLDFEWLPAAVAVTELEAIAAHYDRQAKEADEYAPMGRDDYWRERAEEHRASAARARELAARIASS